MTFDEITSPTAISARAARLLDLCRRLERIENERPTRTFLTEFDRIEWLEDRVASYASLARLIAADAAKLAAVIGYANREQVLGDRPSRATCTSYREVLEAIEAEGTR